MKRFDGRAAFVTGAAHGIGRATAVRLAREGASVTVADLDVQTAVQVADEVTRLGGSAFAVECDVTVRASVDAGLAASIERFGRLDVLVNTAGGDRPEPPFQEADDDLWRRLVDLISCSARCAASGRRCHTCWSRRSEATL